MILEKNSPFMDSRVLVRVCPNFDMIRSAYVEVPGTARYFLASLVMSGYFKQLLYCIKLV